MKAGTRVVIIDIGKESFHYKVKDRYIGQVGILLEDSHKKWEGTKYRNACMRLELNGTDFVCSDIRIKKFPKVV